MLHPNITSSFRPYKWINKFSHRDLFCWVYEWFYDSINYATNFLLWISLRKQFHLEDLLNLVCRKCSLKGYRELLKIKFDWNFNFWIFLELNSTFNKWCKIKIEDKNKVENKIKSSINKNEYK